jgi:uncharacterized protein (TIGR03437 family)
MRSALAATALCLGLLFPTAAIAAKRILYITHSAGFRHDSIRTSIEALEQIGRQTGSFEITATEDLSQLNAATLAQYDAVFFFTSGELAISDSQKQDLLDFVRSGKGFGGAHSATDTLYTWPAYGDLIGGVFDGHPWVQEVAIDVEDPAFPGMREAAPRFSIVEEIYQFREFSRDRVRVLMTLAPESVSLQAPGVKRTDSDFALAWCRQYGQGRVFYTALGHFDETWRDPGFQTMLAGALRWLIGDIAAEAIPRSTSSSVAPQTTPEAIATVAGSAPAGHAPGSIIAIFGEHLTSGSTLGARPGETLPPRLAGTRVEVNGQPIPLYFASPGQVNAQLPFDLPESGVVPLRVWSGPVSGSAVDLPMARFAPALAAAVQVPGALILYATGLGAVDQPVPAGLETPLEGFRRTLETPVVLVNDETRTTSFSGLAPALIGVYQVNVPVTATVPAGAEVELEIGGQRSNRVPLR